jgi:hypothetical protein
MKIQKREIIGLCLLGLAAAMFVFPIITRPVQASQTLGIQVSVTLLKKVHWYTSTGNIQCAVGLDSSTVGVSGQIWIPSPFTSVPVPVGQSRRIGSLQFSNANQIGLLSLKVYDKSLIPIWMGGEDTLLFSRTFPAGQSNTYYASSPTVQVKLQITWT